MECLFCAIIAGDVPSRVVHEDDVAVAFLDLSPWQVGHTLVVPRRHTSDVLADDDVLAELGPSVAKVGRLLLQRLGATAVNVVSNAGADSGQEVFHTHIHVVPRYPDAPGLRALRGDVAEALDVTHARILGTPRERD